MTATDTAAALAISAAVIPHPGSGKTRERFAQLTEHTRRDISVGRLLEAHWDAAAILTDLGGEEIVDGQLWGVWAAESSGAVLTATVDSAGGWSVSGTKPWCSGAIGATHALITARTGERRTMFVVVLDQESVTVHADDWHNAGMIATQTHSVDFDGTSVTRLADADAYLQRPGFWHGAVGVAACWFGGAQLVADRLRRQTKNDDLTLMHLGAVDTALWTGAAALGAAADAIDAHPDDRVGRCLGPGPLVADAAHAQAVADLGVYVRQSHAEHDLRALGELVRAHPTEQIGMT